VKFWKVPLLQEIILPLSQSIKKIYAIKGYKALNHNLNEMTSAIETTVNIAVTPVLTPEPRAV
jgi:hypothetical protein